ncbi:MAG: DUF2807 domain-containing protein [Robiginitomaculum sp.]|nr:DUF2807 domain-containing protein [Robiginitomaculum sp.]
MKTMENKSIQKIKLSAIIGSLAFMMAGAVSAQTYSADAVAVENFVGQVEFVTVPGEEIELSMSAGDGVRDLPQVAVEDGVLRIYYDKRVKVRSCNESGRRGSGSEWLQYVTIKLKGEKKHKLSAYPSLRVSVPANTDLVLKRGVIFGSAGDLASADITVNSCGEFAVGEIAGDLKVKINGSGDIKAGNVTGDLSAGINGSGDIAVKSVNGKTSLRINGSGDIELANVQALSASINGSGDIAVDKANGSVDLSINGSGDIEVRGGEAVPFKASIRGSGEIVFDGHANNVKVYIAGSGDIHVASFEGDLDTGGHRVEVKIDNGRLHVEG